MDVDGAVSVLVVSADLTDSSRATAAVDLALERWGRVDALVNNAGRAELAPIESTDEDLLHRTFAINVYAPAQLIRDAKEHGVEVLPIDVNHSDWNCTLESQETRDKSQEPEKEKETLDSGLSVLPDVLLSTLSSSSCHALDSPGFSTPLALRLGLRMVRGLSQAAAEAIVQARTTEFHSITDLTARAKITRPVVEQLTKADAFGSLQLDRRTALWQALDQASKVEELPLFAKARNDDSPPPALPKLTPQEEVFADYHAAGLTLRQHPMSFCRQELNALGITTADQLGNCRNNRPIKVAGLVLMRQRPSTAKGITFVTLEDETGTSNLIVHARTWQRFDLIARRASALIARGKLERQNGVVHIIVGHLEDMTARIEQLNHQSRDFR